MWIDNDDDVKKLKTLLKADLIGLDMEWRPPLHQSHQTKPALFQISSKECAFVIDLVAMSESRILDEVLTEVFRNEESIIIGFDFLGDIQMFVDHLPGLEFIRYIENFVDA